jgi:hypothetical protein
MSKYKIINKRFPHLVEITNEVGVKKLKDAGLIRAFTIEKIETTPEPKEVKEAKAEKKTKSKDD